MKLHCIISCEEPHGVTVTMPLIIREVHVQHEVIFIQLWGTKVVQNILQRQQQTNKPTPVSDDYDTQKLKPIHLTSTKTKMK